MLVPVMASDCNVCIITITDFGNYNGLQLFRNTLIGYVNNTNHNQKSCKINYKFKEFFTNPNSSAFAVPNYIVGELFKNSNDCIILHASDTKTSQLIFRYAVISSAPIVSTIPEEVSQPCFV